MVSKSGGSEFDSGSGLIELTGTEVFAKLSAILVMNYNYYTALPLALLSLRCEIVSLK